MKLRFSILVELTFIACCLIHVMGFPLQADDDFISSPEDSNSNLWEENEDAAGEQKEKRLWRNWDEEKMKRVWNAQELRNKLYKRLWRNWSTEDDDQVEGNEMKREAEVKRLWRSQENVSESEPLCVPCGKPRCRRSPEKLRPQGGKTLPCCNC